MVIEDATQICTDQVRRNDTFHYQKKGSKIITGRLDASTLSSYVNDNKNILKDITGAICNTHIVLTDRSEYGASYEKCNSIGRASNHCRRLPQNRQVRDHAIVAQTARLCRTIALSNNGPCVRNQFSRKKTKTKFAKF
ncbi:hypothetical protein IFM89_038275 [Coptis chinensis]|uniref:Uncharacterized protein n=1 Tax=Coptis chinensis TaxID=261450 RepID=A0A835IJJ2_9MAGN|nr:hypothetical protein IFM89_038275 [Coptis chinensis]